MLTRLAFLLFVSAGLLAALGCGGGGGSSSPGGGSTGGGRANTFQGNGFSFTYPGSWVKKETGDVKIAAAVVPPKGDHNAVVLSIAGDFITEPITKANIDSAVPALRPAVDATLQGAGAVLEGTPTTVSYAGLPGLRFEGSAAEVQTDHIRITWLFDGTTTYFFSCQSDLSGAEEVRHACDLVLKSFKISH